MLLELFRIEALIRFTQRYTKFIVEFKAVTLSSGLLIPKPPSKKLLIVAAPNKLLGSKSDPFVLPF